ncbi:MULTISPECIES: cytidine deaminase [unclassified Brenneria]|uniref:cytidine deaminase n=1 Tax=unclassified Brenneria TaxID=2634434 RepID=UPI0015581C58|nr:MULTISPECIES: cytidine deaminase [unclassified Brenneria]MBJ7221248.1 cytidine deaminase [Brenneria sp. L3-3C-1]MEE3642492.1 cytidine deaminase [Brenneria sp. L3_3C_1]MEE3650144.1 cytidine deaminase [Brenneria sp. HEZEL_4_2_4]NPD00103.1 cytidine deaminase [Brenneria sp. hezel4-2-4]
MHPRFDEAFQQLPDRLRFALAPILSRPDFAAMLTADEVKTLGDAARQDTNTLAFTLLPLAAACALAPISRFQVGAIAQGSSGNFYFGANMEFTGVPLQQTVHAEQSAIAHAWLRNERELTAVTVNYTPCGHCRQFMNELNAASSLRIQLPGRQPAVLGHYLPDAFGPVDLNISARLMDEVDHAHTLANKDPLALAALQAANRSYAPYSQAISGVALETVNGNVYTGRYAENAAFNPSLPPVQVALNLMNLAGEAHTAIRKAAVVERRHAAVRHWERGETLLTELGCKNVAVYFVD